MVYNSLRPQEERVARIQKAQEESGPTRNRLAFLLSASSCQSSRCALYWLRPGRRSARNPPETRRSHDANTRRLSRQDEFQA